MILILGYLCAQPKRFVNGMTDDDAVRCFSSKQEADDDESDAEMVDVLASSRSALRIRRDSKKRKTGKVATQKKKKKRAKTSKQKVQMRLGQGSLRRPTVDEITADAIKGPAEQFQQKASDDFVSDETSEEPHTLDVSSGEILQLSMPNLPDPGLRVDEDVIADGSSFVEMLKSFKEISVSQIDMANRMWHEVTIIPTVFDLAMNALLSGGVSINIESRDFGEEETRYNNMIWSAFSRDLVRALWMYGFAPVTCERHNNGLNFPRVLDVTQLKVMIRPNVYGRMQYVFFTRQDTFGAPGAFGFGLGNAEETGLRVGGRDGDRFDPDKPLTGIHVFRESEPTASGILTSRVFRCIVPWQSLKEAEETYKVAQARLANPMVVSSRPEQRDQLGVGSMGNLPHMPGMRRRDAAQHQLSPAQIRQRIIASMMAEQANQNIGKPREESTSSSSVSVDQFNPGFSHSVSRGIAHVMLPIGRQLQSHQLPSAPDIIAHRSYFEEMICMVFQVPRAVFSATGTGIRSTGSQATADEVWKFGQRSLRHQVLRCLYQTYHLVRTAENMRDLVTRAPELCTTHEGVMKMVSPKITIGSIPDYDTMRDLLEIGALEYSAFKQYIHMSEGIPLNNLKDTLQPMLFEPYVEDTIEVSEAGSSSSSSSSAPKTTRKQKVLQRAKRGKPKNGGSGPSAGRKTTKPLEKALQLHAPRYG